MEFVDRRAECRLAALGLWCAAGLVHAQEAVQGSAPEAAPQAVQEAAKEAAHEPEQAPAQEPAPQRAPSAARADRFEGAVGLIVKHGSEFPGSSGMSVKVTPAGFVRYGRYTLTGAGGFTTKRADDVERGLSAELLRRDDLRLSLSLRYDNGRQESDSPDLKGMGDIRQTVRARLISRWVPAPGWHLNAVFGVDALGRVGGYTIEGSVGREWRPGPGQTFTLSTGLSGAGDSYMQAWHGVTPEQSERSGYPVFHPAEGLREAHVSAEWRQEFAYHLAGFANVGYGRLLGSAADSPLTKKAGGTGLAAGLVWRF